MCDGVISKFSLTFKITLTFTIVLISSNFFIDEELFSGMYIDFMGTDAAIFRSLTKRNAVRTDQHNSKWLSGKNTFYAFFENHALNYFNSLMKIKLKWF